MSDVQNLLEFLSPPPPFSLKRFELRFLYLTLIFKSCPYVELIRCLNRIHLFWKIFIFYVILKILFRKMQKQTLSYYVHISWIYTLLNIKHFDFTLHHVSVHVHVFQWMCQLIFVTNHVGQIETICDLCVLDRDRLYCQ